jgi:high-affinity Fe2+/Pb2+ permease
MGAAKRKAFGKNNNNCTKTNKIKTSPALDPADQIGLLHLPFWAPYLYFFGVYIFLFLIPLRLLE